MDTRQFGARLRELRKQAGLSQRELAKKVGVSFTYLSKIESGAMPPPSEKVVLRLADVLKADQDDLLTLAGKVPADIAQILKNRETLQLLRSERIQKRINGTSQRRRFSLLRSLVNYKTLSRVAIPLILVGAVATSLWFATPTPVRALKPTFPISTRNEAS